MKLTPCLTYFIITIFICLRCILTFTFKIWILSLVAYVEPGPICMFKSDCAQQNVSLIMHGLPSKTAGERLYCLCKAVQLNSYNFPVLLQLTLFQRIHCCTIGVPFILPFMYWRELGQITLGGLSQLYISSDPTQGFSLYLQIHTLVETLKLSITDQQLPMFIRIMQLGISLYYGEIGNFKDGENEDLVCHTKDVLGHISGKTDWICSQSSKSTREITVQVQIMQKE